MEVHVKFIQVNWSSFQWKYTQPQVLFCVLIIPNPSHGYWTSQSTPEYPFRRSSILAVRTHLCQVEIRGFQAVYSIKRNTSLSINKPRMQEQHRQLLSMLCGIWTNRKCFNDPMMQMDPSKLHSAPQHQSSYFWLSHLLVEHWVDSRLSSTFNFDSQRCACNLYLIFFSPRIGQPPVSVLISRLVLMFVRSYQALLA